MRWDDLFADLESQLEHEIGADDADFRAEEERLRLGQLTLRDRLVSLSTSPVVPGGAVIRLRLKDGTLLPVAPATFGRDWLVGDISNDGTRSPSCLVPLGAIAQLSLTREQLGATLRSPGDDTPSAGARIGLGVILRDLCRRRHGVTVLLGDGTLSGTIDRVGKDHFDLAVHEAGAARREAAVTDYRVIRFDEVLLVRL